MKTRNEVKERYRLETKREVNMPLGDDFSYTDKYVEWLEQMVVKNCSIPDVSQCACTLDETTGTATVKCCNICGKPAESFWHCG